MHALASPQEVRSILSTQALTPTLVMRLPMIKTWGLQTGAGNRMHKST